jgi:hypothetical protein
MKWGFDHNKNVKWNYLLFSILDNLKSGYL